MITRTLSQFTSPIIENAMATGGRSSTTETTNYGTIGDAIFKKAQMDINVSQMKAERELGVANIRANNELAIIDIRKQEEAEHQKRVEESRGLGDMEKALGTLQGVATGAVAGFAAGGPVGAVVGGVAGGGIAASTYYGDSAPGGAKIRETGQRNQAMMNGIATTAVSLRGMYDKKKASDVLGNASKALDGLNQAAQKPGADTDSIAAQRQGIIAKATGEFGKYMGPAEALAAGKALGDGSSTGIFDSDPKKAAYARSAANGVRLAALDPNAPDTPAVARKILQDQQTQMGIITDFDPKKRMSGTAMQNWVNAKNPEVAGSLFGGITTMRSGATQAGPASSASQVQNQEATSPAATTGRTPTSQAPAPTSAPGVPASFISQPPVGVAAPGAGVAMDDGQAFMTQIKGLNEQGAVAAKVLADNQQDDAPPVVDRGEPGAVESVARKVGGVLPGKDNFEQYADKKEQDRGAPVESQRVKDFRADKPLKEVVKDAPDEESHVADKMAVANQRVELAVLKAKNSGFASPESAAKIENGQTANKAVNEMVEIVNDPDFPTGSRFKAIAMEVRTQGVNMQPVGTVAGMVGGGVAGFLSPVPGGLAGGATLGGAAGTAATKGVRAGKGSTLGLTKKEQALADRLAIVTQDFKQAYNKMQEPGTMKEHEEEMMDSLLVDGRFEKDAIISKLYTVNDHVAKRMEHVATSSEGTRTGNIKQTAIEANIRANADIGKTEEITRQRYRTMMEEKAAAEQVPEVDLTGTGLIRLN